MNNQTSTSSPLWAKIAIAIGFIALIIVGIRTVTNSDTYMHLAAGREIVTNGIPGEDTLSYTAEGASWVDLTWLYDSLLYRIWNMGGAGAATWMHILLTVAAFGFLVPVAKKFARPAAVACSMLLSALLLLPVFDVRPDTFGLFFAAIYIFLLSEKRPLWLEWAVLIILQIIWTNMHGSFLIGPVIGLAFAAQNLIAAQQNDEQITSFDTPDSKRTFSLFALSMAMLAVTMINPYGLALHKTLFAYGLQTGAAIGREWISSFSYAFIPTMAKNILYLSFIFIAAGWIAQKKQLPFAITSLAIVGAVIVVFSMWHIGLYAILAFAFISLSLDGIASFAERIFKQAAGPLGMAVVIVVALLILVQLPTNGYYASQGSAASFGLGETPSLYPGAAMNALQDSLKDKRILQLPSDGNYMAWANPEIKLFSDNRLDVYSDDFNKQVFDGLLRGDLDTLEELMQEWAPDAIIIKATHPNAGVAIRTLQLSGSWALIYFDGISAVLVQPTADLTSLVGNAAMQQAGLQSLQDAYMAYKTKVDAGKTPAVCAPLVGAGAIFLSLGEFDRAAAIYSVLTRGAPKMAVGWLNLGVSLVQSDQAEQGTACLEQACNILPKKHLMAPRAWLWLSRAYERIGETRAAGMAFDRAKKMNPQLAETFGDPTASPTE